MGPPKKKFLSGRGSPELCHQASETLTKMVRDCSAVENHAETRARALSGHKTARMRHEWPVFQPFASSTQAFKPGYSFSPNPWFLNVQTVHQKSSAHRVPNRVKTVSFLRRLDKTRKTRNEKGEKRTGIFPHFLLKNSEKSPKKDRHSGVLIRCLAPAAAPDRLLPPLERLTVVPGDRHPRSVNRQGTEEKKETHFSVSYPPRPTGESVRRRCRDGRPPCRARREGCTHGFRGAAGRKKPCTAIPFQPPRHWLRLYRPGS